MSSRLEKLLRIWRRWHASSPRVRIGPDCALETGVLLRPGMREGSPGRVSIGAGCTLSQGAVLDSWGGSIELGARVFVGPCAVVYGQGGVEIGDDCLLSMHCRVLSSEHALPPLDRRIRWEPDILKPTRLGRDVWLGAGATVLGGVVLGDGCVIGAGAVVTRDLPPGAIAVGIPARVVGHRPAARV